MAEITKVYKEHFPALRFIGKIYTNADRQNGSYGAKWGEWFQKGWFDLLEKLNPSDKTDNGYLGLMSCSETEDSFIYCVGMFFSADTEAPEGFSSLDLPESDIGMCWIYGKENGDNIYGMHDECMKRLNGEGLGQLRDDIMNSYGKKYVFFERYNCPRFTTPDESGKIILDYGTYIK